MEQNKEEGLSHLKKSMSLNPSYRSGVLEKIQWYHEGQGEYNHVENLNDALDETLEKDQKASEERSSVSHKDTFKEHLLPSLIVDNLLKRMQPFINEIKECYLVQKQLKFYPEEPLYVLVIKGHPQGFRWSIDNFNVELLNKLLEHVDLEYTQGSLYFLVGDKSVIKKVKKIPNALIYQKS